MNTLKLVNWKKESFAITYGPNLVKLTRLNHRCVFLLKYGTTKRFFTVPVSKAIRHVRYCTEVGPDRLNRFHFWTHPISLDLCSRKTSFYFLFLAVIFEYQHRVFLSSFVCYLVFLSVVETASTSLVYVVHRIRPRLWVLNFFLPRDGRHKVAW